MVLNSHTSIESDTFFIKVYQSHYSWYYFIVLKNDHTWYLISSSWILLEQNCFWRCFGLLKSSKETWSIDVIQNKDACQQHSQCMISNYVFSVVLLIMVMFVNDWLGFDFYDSITKKECIWHPKLKRHPVVHHTFLSYVKIVLV